MTSSDPKPSDDFSNDEEISNSSGRLRVAAEITVAALILVGIYFLFAPDEQIDLEPPLKESQIDPIIRAQIDSANQTENPVSNRVVSPVESEIEDSPNPTIQDTPTDRVLKKGEAARALISRLRSRESIFSSDQIVDQVIAFQQQGNLTDAYLLLFYAAREGDGPAAFALASMHDPNHFVEGNTLLDNPDAYQAHKWYVVAAEKDITAAQKRLQVLRSTTEEQAKTGDLAAQRLLLNWQ
ncbi:MAG: deoxyribonuclease [Candidatus Thiodiazotropha sp.]|nr:deoxyribonuclease [Candidatus Thiodiazotropha sp.]MCM8885521.1 deoxyribonuclease [Candidatus Thiodiazotropha sp.]MCM8921949.1 deoxyribonuclease [Candidatus Thiodiazotropha sp.]